MKLSKILWAIILINYMPFSLFSQDYFLKRYDLEERSYSRDLEVINDTLITTISSSLGSSRKGRLLFLNDKGEPQYQKKYTDTKGIAFQTLAKDQTGNLYVGGYRKRTGTDRSPMVLRLDGDGEIIGAIEYPNAGRTAAFRSIDIISDEYIIASGAIAWDQLFDGWIAKLDLEGNAIWNSKLELNDPTQGSSISSVMRLASGDHIMLGNISIDAATAVNSESHLYIGAFTTDGELIWGYRYLEDPSYGLNMVELPNGDFCVAYLIDDDNLIVVHRLSANGDRIWSKGYRNSTILNLASLKLSHDGNLIIAGAKHNTDYGSPNGMLMKIDFDGNFIWAKDYGISEKASFFMDIEGHITAEDSIYYVAGNVLDVAGNVQREFMKVNENGEGYGEGCVTNVFINVEEYTVGRLDAYSSLNTNPGDVEDFMNDIVVEEEWIETSTYNCIYLDLDKNNSEANDADYAVSLDCYEPSSLVSITDEDIELLSNFPIDSILISITDANVDVERLVYLGDNPAILSAELDNRIVLRNIDNASLNDFEIAIQNVFYQKTEENFSSLIRDIELIAYQGEYIGNIANAKITLPETRSILLNLGSDTTYICDNILDTLDAFHPNIDHYLWQDGSTNSFYELREAGEYSVEVWNNCDTLIDTITVEVVDWDLSVNLGNDTTLCPGDTILLDAFNEGPTTYLWQDNSNASTYTVSQAGKYTVKIENVCEILLDSIEVDYIERLNLDLGVDTSICAGEVYTLNASQTEIVNYLWQDATTDSIYEVRETGLYTVEIWNVCDTIQDTTNIRVFDFGLSVNLGNDTTLCPEETIILDVYHEEAETYFWQDSSVISDYIIREPGTYYVRMDNQCETVSDTLEVDYVDALQLNLGVDTILCEGEVYRLNAFDSSATYYLWQDTLAKFAIDVKKDGLYYAEIGNDCQTLLDTVEILFSPVDLSIDLGGSQNICEGDTIVLDVTTPYGVHYTWQDGTDTSVYTVTSSGVYSVVVENTCTESRDSLVIKGEDCCQLYIPNVFSPNGDGVNDIFHVFQPEFGCSYLSGFKMTIFNRWGAVLYQTNNIEAGWNGEFSGEIVTEGVYVYIIEYNDGVKNYLLKGDVSIVL